jgi:hypothetical protein
MDYVTRSASPAHLPVAVGVQGVDLSSSAERDARLVAASDPDTLGRWYCTTAATVAAVVAASLAPMPLSTGQLSSAAPECWLMSGAALRCSASAVPVMPWSAHHTCWGHVETSTVLNLLSMQAWRCYRCSMCSSGAWPHVGLQPHHMAPGQAAGQGAGS